MKRLLSGDRLELVPANRELRLDGEPVPLPAKPFALLAALMEAAPRVVTKDELVEAGWQGRAVSDAVLTTAIKEIRQALGDNARKPEWIETKHGLGYRFCRTVEMTEAVEGLLEAIPEEVLGGAGRRERPQAGWRRFYLPLLAGIAVSVVLVLWLANQRAPELTPLLRKSVVVFPMTALDEETSRLAPAISEEVVTTLGRTPDLVVAGDGVTQRLLAAGENADLAARREGFGHILQGTVRREGDRLRINVRLRRTATGADIWSNRFDRPLSDLIEVQEQIAYEIALALNTVMEPEKLREMGRIGTRSVPAYLAFAKGQDAMERAFRSGDPSPMDEARNLLQQARRLDPSFARAHWLAGYMELLTFNTIYADRSPNVEGTDRRERYIAYMDQAVASAPSATDRLLYQAAREVADLNYRRSTELLVRYLEERPQDTAVWFNLLEHARIAERYDLVDEAIASITELLQRQGDFAAIGTNYMVHDPEAAKSFSERAMEARPDSAALQFQAHRGLLIAGEIEAAAKLQQRIEEGRLPSSLRRAAAVRQACAEGRTEDARKAASAVLDDPDAPLSAKWSTAMTAGLVDQAYAVLEPLAKDGDTMTLAQYLIYREFEASRFPTLTSALTKAGISRPPAVQPPYACAAG
ncbi:winged helix-turn-helix domain-containing protein [Parvularcula maris]|uniref:Winged helix-turn-helix domain-containing protein n=1 Tax=Parvularcula maris TaxID=2965077 RepID=A0A9X2RIJ6_9PROT|nr:winged helix-turn-helix domain-containing protein [Parvularcula maris]MCQ8186074.1 winged helix-turn-helix domain-containing protein [Parvularcula maris]